MTAFSLIDALVSQGIFSFCIAPGSRSTPLVQAVINHPKAKSYVHFDERGLGFFALGLSMETKRPSALIITSGTAIANLLPAVMEASYSDIPLLVLSADRPIEDKDAGVNQTCEQSGFFQKFARFQAEITPEMEEKTVRSIAYNAAMRLMHPHPGPVHINCPFREPLYQPMQAPPSFSPSFSQSFGKLSSPPFTTSFSRGVITIGKLPERNDLFPILKLAESLGWPIIADILSEARLFPTKEQIHPFSHKLYPTPQILLHFGNPPVEKTLLQWMQKAAITTLHISPFPSLIDPTRSLNGRVCASIPSFCAAFQAEKDPDWLSLWLKKHRFIGEEAFGYTEIHLMRDFSASFPPGFAAFFGNGRAIRDADLFFFPKNCSSIFANRGLSGIDGNIATIAGIAEQKPVIGFIGDQAALHDLNSFSLLKKTRYPALVLVSNNFGGGIFHHLPVRRDPFFASHWAFSHRWDFAKIALMFDLPYFKGNLKDALRSKRSGILEYQSDREKNHAYRKSLTLGSAKERTACPDRVSPRVFGNPK